MYTPSLREDTCHLRPKHAWAIGVVNWVMAILCAAPMLSPTRNSPTETWGMQQQQSQCLCQVPRNGGQPARGLQNLQFDPGRPGCFLPLLFIPMADSVLGLVVLRSQGTTTAQKLLVVVLAASGVALYACSYVPYHITQVLHVDAKMCWMAPASPIRDRLALQGYGAQPVLPPKSLRR